MPVKNPAASVPLKKLKFPLTAAIVLSVMLLSKMTHTAVILICIWEVPADTVSSEVFHGSPQSIQALAKIALSSVPQQLQFTSFLLHYSSVITHSTDGVAK
jgi:hypothetical protein